MVPLCQLLLLNNIFVIVFCGFVFSILYQLFVSVLWCAPAFVYALCSSLMLYSIISIAIVSVFAQICSYYAGILVFTFVFLFF